MACLAAGDGQVNGLASFRGVVSMVPEPLGTSWFAFGVRWMACLKHSMGLLNCLVLEYSGWPLMSLEPYASPLEAGFDCQLLIQVMMFVPSIGGISHSFEEHTEELRVWGFGKWGRF